MNRDELKARAEEARAALAHYAQFDEDDKAEGRAHARKEAALEAFHAVATPDAVLTLLGPDAAVDPAALRATALAATPGPWWQGPYYRSDVLSGDGRIAEASPFRAPRSDANAAYIAAIDPTTLLALLSERDALAARVADWQPITTAPTDGTRVLLWNACWTGPDAGCHHGYLGWGGSSATVYRWQPTHWMPLPAPPAPEGQK